MTWAFWLSCLMQHSAHEMPLGSAQAQTSTCADVEVPTSGLSFSYRAHFQWKLLFLEEAKRRNKSNLNSQDLIWLPSPQGTYLWLGMVSLEPISHLGGCCWLETVGPNWPRKRRVKQWWCVAIFIELIFSSLLINGYTDNQLGIRCDRLQ